MWTRCVSVCSCSRRLFLPTCAFSSWFMVYPTWVSCLALVWLALPCLGLASLALPCLGLASLALPCLALPWLVFAHLGLAWLGMAWLGFTLSIVFTLILFTIFGTFGPRPTEYTQPESIPRKVLKNTTPLVGVPISTYSAAITYQLRGPTNVTPPPPVCVVGENPTCSVPAL